MSVSDQNDLTFLTVQLLSAYVSKNEIASTDLAELIKTTRAALAGAPAVEEAAPQVFTPAVSARKSLASRDHILSMIDGKPYKTLKRHLASHGLSPKEYLERYKLPSDYPFVAPAYSEIRRETAAKIGLGHKKKPEAASPEPIAVAAPEAVPETTTAPAIARPKAEAKKAPAPKKAAVKSQTEATSAAETAMMETTEAAPVQKARSKASVAGARPDTKKEEKPSAAKAPAAPQGKAGRPKLKVVTPAAE